ncbi:MAG TPA: BatD family protein, partial [Nitriliruptorales bacterium]
MSRRAPHTAAFALLALLLGPAAGAAQDVTVRAYVTPSTTVALGTPFTLNVEVGGTQVMGAEPVVPDLSAFAQFLSSSTQSAMRVVNGRTSVTLTVQYRYQALTEGTWDVPAFDVQTGGRTLRTQPLRMAVSARVSGAGQPGQVQPGQGPAEGVGPDDLFITAEASKTRVLDGEPLVVEYRIWTRVDVSSFNFTRVPEPEGFWVEDVTPAGQPQVEQLTRNGQQYASAVIRRVALVPTGVGTRTISPIVLEAQVRVRDTDPFDRFFGGRSLFGASTVPAGITSDPLTIVVAPLPAGAPQPFSGVVGSLSATASVDRDSVATNEAVTLTLRVSGDGNLRAVQPPDLGLPSDFEVFPPEISESVQAFGSGLTGSKT